MSTLTPASDRVLNSLSTPAPEAQAPSIPTLNCATGAMCATAVTGLDAAISGHFFPELIALATRVPGESANVDLIRKGTLALAHISTALGWMTLAPCTAICAISSYVIWSIVFAPGTSLGSAVFTPSTSV